MKLRKTIEVDVPIDSPWTVTPASSEFTVTLDETPVSQSTKDDSLILDLPVAEIHEDDRAISKSLSALWSNEDESPVIGTIKPKR